MSNSGDVLQRSNPTIKISPISSRREQIKNCHGIYTRAAGITSTFGYHILAHQKLTWPFPGFWREGRKQKGGEKEASVYFFLQFPFLKRLIFLFQRTVQPVPSAWLETMNIVTGLVGTAAFLILCFDIFPPQSIAKFQYLSVQLFTTSSSRNTGDGWQRT